MEEDDGERRDERISNNSSKSVRAQESFFLEWSVKERERRKSGRRWLEYETEKGRGERERNKRGKVGRQKNRKPVQPVSGQTTQLSAQTAR
jgi:hypothetical protein